MRNVLPWKKTHADGSITDETGWRKKNKKIDGEGVEVEVRNQDIPNWFATRKDKAARVTVAAANAAKAPEKSSAEPAAKRQKK